MKVSVTAAYSLHALMHMVRHTTQLPVSIDAIVKAEGIPAEPLYEVFEQLTNAGFVKVAKDTESEYVFARSPDDVSLLELFEHIDGQLLFTDCPLRHCECGGTTENCCIFAKWMSAIKKLKQLFAETSLATAAWNHPEHRFYSLPESL